MRARVLRLSPWWVPIAILWPSLIWIAQDRAVWPWDQAWFGAHTVTLYETLRHDLLRWPAALLHATPLKPPAVAWIGQFFVPLGMALGSVDLGLLLSVWTTHAAVLFVVFRALMAVSGERRLVAAAGALSVGASAPFIALTTQYLAEGTQSLAVAWFVFIMIGAARWSRVKIAAHLVAATSFAMLAKTTSPAFCALPGLLAVAALIRRKDGAEESARTPARRQLAVAAALAVLTLGWYWVNLDAVLSHFRIASVGPVAELYGRRTGYGRALFEWWYVAAIVFFIPPVAWLLAALGLVAVARRMRERPRSPDRHGLVAGVAALQVALTLAIFALSPNRDPRYVVALLPLIAVPVSWVVAQYGRPVTLLVSATLVAQLALTHTQVLGVAPARPRVLQAAGVIDPAINQLHLDSRAAAELATIVRRTCAPGSPAMTYNFVGVDLFHLSGHSLTYAAAKERLAGRAGNCRYDSIAFSPIEAAEAAVKAAPYLYWIDADPRVIPVPAHHAFLNQTAPVQFARLRRRGVLQREPWDDAPPGIRLFRFVRP